MKIYYLSTAFDIARKISFQKEKTYTRFIVRLSIAATAISVAAIILTLAIVNGFQQSISDKVYQFWGHIRVASVSGEPIELNQNTNVLWSDSVASVTPFINQSCVLSYGPDIEGVVMKGIPANSKIPFVIKGTVFNTQDTSRNDIIISDALANKLKIPLDSSIRIYLLNNGNVVQRKMNIRIGQSRIRRACRINRGIIERITGSCRHLRSKQRLSNFRRNFLVTGFTPTRA